MKLIRTAKIKLNISVAEVLPTIQAYTKAFNFVCSVGYDKKDKNGVSLHKKTYQSVREYLPAQLAISSRMRATDALKGIFSQKKNGRSRNKYPQCPVSKLCSVRYDVNSYSLFLESGIISLLTISGRKRLPIAIPEYYREYFTWKHTSADLCITGKQVYLHITFEKEINDAPSSGNFVGIDRGINNLAVASNNQFFGGGVIKKQVRKYQRLRSGLQKKGTKSAKRHLRRLSGKERRFRADINHQISKQIIATLSPGDTIVLEDLTGIRNKRLRKAQRTLINSWSFFQLEQFLTYKAKANGISVVHVDARYTSQGCSACGFVDRKNRDRNDFCCRECGFSLNADLNASRNVVIKHLASYTDANRALVNEPIVGAAMLLTSCQSSG